jgi:hypothetical protein
MKKCNGKNCNCTDGLNHSTECIEEYEKSSGQAPSTARDKQVGGTHYTDMKVQPWDAIKASRGKEAFVEYLIGTVIKYTMRAGHKGDKLEDLEKAHHVLGKAIEEVREEKHLAIQDALSAKSTILENWVLQQAQLQKMSDTAAFCVTCGHSKDRHVCGDDDFGENQCSCGCPGFSSTMGCKSSNK